MPNAENILLIRFKSIGDILFTLPAVHVVRENFPQAKISFMVSKEHAPLIEGFRNVDEVIPVDRTLYRSQNPARIVMGTFSLLRRLRRGKFSLAVDFQGYGETAWLTWLTGARERWGIVYQPARAWAYTRGFEREEKSHLAQENVSMLKEGGLKIGTIRNDFVLPAPALEDARRFFAAEKLDAARPTLFIQPFTSSPHKNWPLAKYLELAEHWRNRGVQILFGGGPAERDAIEPAHAAGFPVSAGATLLVTGGLMKLSTLVVGGDTGLPHLAVAMKKRVVMIMKSSVTYPFQHPEWVITPGERQAISKVRTEDVIEACRRAFAEPPADH